MNKFINGWRQFFEAFEQWLFLMQFRFDLFIWDLDCEREIFFWFLNRVPSESDWVTIEYVMDNDLI